jgi:histidinol phosphatase-like enzyme
MLRRAAGEYRFDLARAVIVGARACDGFAAGRQAGAIL